jgi:two-component system response regulator YesN
LSVRVGIGGVKSGFRAFADSFDEAFRQCSASRPLFAEVRSIRFYHQLVEAVRNCQESQAFGLIDEYVSHLKALKQISSAELTHLGNELWTILAYSLYDLGIELERIRPRFDFPEAETPEHLADWLHSIVSDILRSRHWNDNIKHKQAVDFMINYIREHYNEEITLGELSRHVFISQNYLGQIFKNVVGETLNQYVTRIRIDKAKEMVLEGKYYIYEIAEKVGYTNIPYFTTLFKKQIGFNPSELLKK